MEAVHDVFTNSLLSRSGLCYRLVILIVYKVEIMRYYTCSVLVQEILTMLLPFHYFQRLAAIDEFRDEIAKEVNRKKVFSVWE